MYLIRLRSSLYCTARSVQVGRRLQAMPSLPKMFGGDERLVVFPCQSFNEMDRFLKSLNPLSGELFRDVLVGEQFLRAGFLCGWGLQGIPASRATPRISSLRATFLYRMYRREAEQERGTAEVEIGLRGRRGCAKFARSHELTV